MSDDLGVDLMHDSYPLDATPGLRSIAMINLSHRKIAAVNERCLDCKLILAITRR